MATYSNILPGESHGQKSLAGYSPWGHKELDMTEHTHMMHDMELTAATFQKPQARGILWKELHCILES